MLEQGEIITLSDNVEYIVALSFDYNSNHYVYITNYNDENDNKICLVNDDKLVEVTDELLLAELDEEIQKYIPNE